MIAKLLPSFIFEKLKGVMFIYERFENIDTSALVEKCLEEKD